MRNFLKSYWSSYSKDTVFSDHPYYYLPVHVSNVACIAHAPQARGGAGARIVRCAYRIATHSLATTGIRHTLPVHALRRHNCIALAHWRLSEVFLDIIW